MERKMSLKLAKGMDKIKESDEIYLRLQVTNIVKKDSKIINKRENK